MPLPPRDEDYMVEVGRRLAATRRALGLKQEEMAADIAVSRSALANWERGERLADLPAMARLAHRHAVSLDWIYLGEPASLPRDLAQKLLAEL